MTEKYLAETVLAFVKDSSYQMGVHRIKKDQCRIAFPSYLERSFLSGMVEIYGPMHFQSEKLTNIKGIEVHPTWENAITFYYIHSVRFPEENIPVFKLNFDTNPNFNLWLLNLKYINHNSRIKCKKKKWNNKKSTTPK